MKFNLGERNRDIDGVHQAAERALQVGGARAMVDVITTSGVKEEEPSAEQRAAKERMLQDHAIADIVYQTQGSAAAVRALAHLRGWFP